MLQLNVNVVKKKIFQILIVGKKKESEMGYEIYISEPEIDTIEKLKEGVHPFSSEDKKNLENLLIKYESKEKRMKS